MASAQSLLGLVNQLQNMESCFTSILMEGAMKLSALCDAKIFILVETSEGRRFCGKRHLCDQYMRGGGLAPVGNDVEVEVDANVSAIRERLPLPEQSDFNRNVAGCSEKTDLVCDKLSLINCVRPFSFCRRG